MAPWWLEIVAKISLTLAVLSALIIALDVWRHRQKMAIMNVVWPITGLYFGPLALWAYFSLGRMATKAEDNKADDDKKKKPFWASTFVGVTHCGAGCTLGDFVGEWTVFLLGWTIAGLALWPELIADFTLAFLIGVVFQYFAIAPMRHLQPLPGIWAAIKADALSITAYEIGMFIWMVLMRFVFFPHHPLHPNQASYWFMMQIAMIVGFATSYPMNWWLIRQGLKEKM